MGAEDGETDLLRMSHSYRNTLNTDLKGKRIASNIESVLAMRGETWLSDYNLNPSDIDILRMDVEGFEADVLRGLLGIFDNDPNLVHIEFQTNALDEDDLSFLINLLNDFKILAAGQRSEVLPLNSMEGVKRYRNVEIVARY